MDAQIWVTLVAALGVVVSLATFLMITQRQLRLDLKGELKEGLRGLDAKIDRVNEKVDKVDEKVDKVDAKLDRTREELQASISKVDAKVDRTREELQDRAFRLLERIDNAS